MSLGDLKRYEFVLGNDSCGCEIRDSDDYVIDYADSYISFLEAIKEFDKLKEHIKILEARIELLGGDV